MKASFVGTRRQAVLFGVLALLLIFFVVRWSSREKPAGSPATVVASGAEDTEPRAARSGRRRVATPGPDEIPPLTARDLEPRLRAAGGDAAIRDLFDPREPTKPPPPPPTPAPPPPPGPGHVDFVGPLPPPLPTPTPTPPEPPFRLIGIFGPKERPIAVLANGEELINARAGEVVLGRWIVKKVGYESIDVGFVGPWTETRRLPITQ
ncbi:MAG TPA: hypothetical protein VFW15_09115 [Thermoanaerobaculia bacterium]|nr:hypothetical protein [Thermoanaerobaculia bacterium]